MCLCSGWAITTGTATIVIVPDRFSNVPNVGVFFTLHALMTMSSLKMRNRLYVPSVRLVSLWLSIINKIKNYPGRLAHMLVVSLVFFIGFSITLIHFWYH